MSLVNEALKKARLEAARQDAARRGLPLPGAHPPAGRRVAGPSLLKAGVVLLLVAAAAVLFFAGRYTSSDPSAVTTTGQAVATTPEVATAPRLAPPVKSPAGLADAPEGARELGAPDRAAGEPPVVSTPPAPNEPSTAQAVPRDAPAEPSAPRPLDRASRVRVRTPLSSPPGAAGQTEVRADTPPTASPPAAVPERRAQTPIRTEVRTLELPGSRRIELGGIAWSEDRPFALINGRVVGPGDTIESLTVVSIEQRAVELEGEAGRFLLRLK